MGAKVTFRFSDRVSVDANGNIKEMMESLNEVCEVFGHAGACGACGGTNIVPKVRTPQGFTYYELQCMNPDCGARLSFGQHQEGDTLFAKTRNAESGQPLENGGWAIYQGNQQPAKPKQQAKPKSAKPADGTDYGGSELPF